jgi:hypothetical protein
VGVCFIDTVNIDDMITDDVKDVDPDRMSEETVVMELSETVLVTVAVAEIVVVVLGVPAETTKGQQSGLSFTHPMKAA